MKKILAMLLALTLLAGMAACSGTSPADQPAADAPDAPAPAAPASDDRDTPSDETKDVSNITLAVVSTNQGNPVFYDLQRGVEETAKNMGVELMWYAPETADSVKEAELIEQAANAGVDAIGVVPFDQTLTTTMQSVSERGIPVAAINNDTIRYDGLDLSLGTPQYDIGHDVGVIAAGYLTDTSKTYTIAIIECDAGNETFGLRIQGFQDALDEAGVKYEVIGDFPCNDDTAKAVEDVETFTATNPDLDMWFFAGGWPLMVDVASEPNLAAWHAQEGHYCVSVDAFPPMKAFFDAGLCDGCSGQFYYNMGKMTVEYLVKLVQGESLPEPDSTLDGTIPWYSTGTMMITPDTYQAAFADMTPW